MAIKIVTSWNVLMQKARAAGKAELSGNVEEYELAKADLEAYEELCKTSDHMVLPPHD